MFIGDSAPAYKYFTNKHELKYDKILGKEYKSKEGNTLAHVNKLHESIKSYLKSYKGVSVRYLQKYLYLFLFYLKYKSLNELIYLTKYYKHPIKCRDIVKQNYPVDVEKIYSDPFLMIRYQLNLHKYRTKY